MCFAGDRLDYEGEVAIVVGNRPIRNVAARDALQYVLGFTAANDVSNRYWQRNAGGGQWGRGKGFDTFCPVGPVVTTTEAIGDPQNLRLRTMVNGETRQDSNTSDMIFTIAEIVEWLSKDTTLRPGTIILTGTPEGVGYAMQPKAQWLAVGDVVSVEIENIGAVVNTVALPPV